MIVCCHIVLQITPWIRGRGTRSLWIQMLAFFISGFTPQRKQRSQRWRQVAIAKVKFSSSWSWGHVCCLSSSFSLCSRFPLWFHYSIQPQAGTKRFSVSVANAANTGGASATSSPQGECAWPGYVTWIAVVSRLFSIFLSICQYIKVKTNIHV